MRAIWIAAVLVVGVGHAALAQIRDGQEFQLATAGGMTATLQYTEVHHVQVDNTIDIAVVLVLSRPISNEEGVVAAAEFCIRYGAEFIAAVRAQGTQTPVHVFVPLFWRSATVQTGFGFAGETCPLDPPYPQELRAAATAAASAPLVSLRTR